MIHLYKKRNFGEVMSDTFNFFKLEGKNFYKNYFIINGPILLVLIVLFYIFFNFLFESALSARTNSTSFENNLFNNLPLIISGSIIIFILMIILSLIGYLYPVAYLKLYSQQTVLSTTNLWNEIKSKIGKALLFSIISMFVFVPLMVLFFAIGFALVFLLIGIPFLFILAPAVICWFSFSFYNYIQTNDGYFDSLSKGMKLLMKKPWLNIGSVLVFYIIVQSATSIIAFIPYFIGIGNILVNPEGFASGDMESISFMIIMFSTTMLLTFILSFILQNLVLINQGILFYTMKDESENISQISDIDLIGISENE